MTRAVGRPCHGVDASGVSSEFGDGDGGDANVQHDGAARVHLEGREVVGILFVPFQSQQRFQVGSFVYDGGMFETSQIEQSDGAVGAHRGENVGSPREGQVEDLSVVSDELRPCGLGVDVPDGAGGVDGGGTNHGWVVFVPVKGCQGGAVFAVFVLWRRDREFDFEDASEKGAIDMFQTTECIEEMNRRMKSHDETNVPSPQ